MNRRQLLSNTTLGAVAAAMVSRPDGAQSAAITTTRPLKAPPAGKITVAVLISESAQVIDFAGPWEVFQDVHVPDRGNTMDAQMPFQLYTVAPTAAAIHATGGMKIVPDYTFANAPKAQVIVVPAQGGLKDTAGEAKEWLTSASRTSDVTMSVCTGAFVLGTAGLLDGLMATTYFRRIDQFEKAFPNVRVLRGQRFVENDRISTSAGLSAGIDLALRVVERYFGRTVAAETAANLEYEGRGWIT
jgi:transcriptional regulator GlxA family with amidase domain